jgi:purine-binding chemotaxis protein CheW
MTQTRLKSLNTLDTPEIKQGHLSEESQYLGFKIEQDEFLLSVELVREIVTLPLITCIPNSHIAIEGVIALRGEIMPVINLRRILRFEKGDSRATARIIVIQLEEKGCYGLLVDEITDFLWLNQKEIEPISNNFFSEEYHILSGVAKIQQKVKGIVDARLVTRVWDQAGAA